MSYRIVSFFAPPDDGTAAAAIDDLVPVNDQVAYLLQSARRTHPDVTMSVLTDRIRFGPEVDHRLFDTPIVAEKMMLQAAEMFREFFNDFDFGTPAVLSDPDLIILKDLSHVFDGDFDIAITRRSDSKMPYNSGIIFVNNRRPDKARAFFALQARLIEDRLMANANWFADQLVLNEIVEMASPVDGPSMLEVNGIRLAILDADEYNFSPPREHPGLLSFPKVSVYHFKGRCRTYMPAFFFHFVCPGRSRPVLRFLDTIRLARQRSRLKNLFRGDTKRLKS